MEAEGLTMTEWEYDEENSVIHMYVAKIQDKADIPNDSEASDTIDNESIQPPVRASVLRLRCDLLD